MEKYIALVHKSGTEYGISFPDVLGCSSGGDSFEQAVANGAVALAGHIEALLQEGLAVPVARSLEAIKAAKEDWVDWDRAIVTAIPLLPTSGKRGAKSRACDC